jgi:nucleoside-diphosphate-sugar epimerase
MLRLESEPPMTRFVARELSTAHWFNIDAARRDLGYQPEVSINEGLRRLASWLEREMPAPPARVNDPATPQGGRIG